jgi:hypothetical protein
VEPSAKKAAAHGQNPNKAREKAYDRRHTGPVKPGGSKAVAIHKARKAARVVDDMKNKRAAARV